MPFPRPVATLMSISIALIGPVACSVTGEGDDDAGEGLRALSGPYLGQPAPGLDPELFAPGLVSTGLFDRDVAVSEDGLELYFTVAYSGGSSIMVARQVGGVWREPVVAPFSGEHRDFEPCLALDGSQVLFLSNRPPEGRPAKPGWGYQNIWAAERTESGWGEPFMLSPPINTEASEFFPSLTSDGTLYFTRGEDPEHAAIYRSRLENGAYRQVEKLSDQVNATGLEYNAFIAGDESFLLYSTSKRDDSFGGSDCYVAFRSPGDSWSPPVNLGAAVNDEGDCDSAMVTPDGRYLFFMSTRRDPELEGPLTGLTLGQLQERLTRPGNGSADIYWVDAAIVERLRPMLEQW